MNPESEEPRKFQIETAPQPFDTTNESHLEQAFNRFSESPDGLRKNPGKINNHIRKVNLKIETNSLTSQDVEELIEDVNGESSSPEARWAAAVILKRHQAKVKEATGEDDIIVNSALKKHGMTIEFNTEQQENGVHIRAGFIKDVVQESPIDPTTGLADGQGGYDPRLGTLSEAPESAQEPKKPLADRARELNEQLNDPESELDDEQKAQQIKDFLESIPEANEYIKPAIPDLQPVVETYHKLVGQEQFDETREKVNAPIVLQAFQKAQDNIKRMNESPNRPQEPDIDLDPVDATPEEPEEPDFDSNQTLPSWQRTTQELQPVSQEELPITFPFNTAVEDINNLINQGNPQEAANWLRTAIEHDKNPDRMQEYARLADNPEVKKYMNKEPIVEGVAQKQDFQPEEYFDKAITQIDDESPDTFTQAPDPAEKFFNNNEELKDLDVGVLLEDYQESSDVPQKRDQILSQIRKRIKQGPGDDPTDYNSLVANLHRLEQKELEASDQSPLTEVLSHAQNPELNQLDASELKELNRKYDPELHAIREETDAIWEELKVAERELAAMAPNERMSHTDFIREVNELRERYAQASIAQLDTLVSLLDEDEINNLKQDLENYDFLFNQEDYPDLDSKTREFTKFAGSQGNEPDIVNDKLNSFTSEFQNVLSEWTEKIAPEQTEMESEPVRTPQSTPEVSETPTAQDIIENNQPSDEQLAAPTQPFDFDMSGVTPAWEKVKQQHAADRSKVDTQESNAVSQSNIDTQEMQAVSPESEVFQQLESQFREAFQSNKTQALEDLATAYDDETDEARKQFLLNLRADLLSSENKYEFPATQLLREAQEKFEESPEDAIVKIDQAINSGALPSQIAELLPEFSRGKPDFNNRMFLVNKLKERHPDFDWEGAIQKQQNKQEAVDQLLEQANQDPNVVINLTRSVAERFRTAVEQTDPNKNIDLNKLQNDLSLLDLYVSAMNKLETTSPESKAYANAVEKYSRIAGNYLKKQSEGLPVDDLRVNLESSRQDLLSANQKLNQVEQNKDLENSKNKARENAEKNPSEYMQSLTQAYAELDKAIKKYGFDPQYSEVKKAYDKYLAIRQFIPNLPDSYKKHQKDELQAHNEFVDLYNKLINLDFHNKDYEDIAKSPLTFRLKKLVGAVSGADKQKAEAWNAFKKDDKKRRFFQ